MCPLIAIRPVIERAWSIDTTWTPETYQGKDPAWGQCGVTSLYLLQYLEEHNPALVSSTAKMPSSATRHFWLLLHGVPVDFTARQFPIGTELLDHVIVTAEEIVENSWFQERYHHFSNQVAAQVIGWNTI